MSETAAANTDSEDQEKRAECKSASCLIPVAFDTDLVAEAAKGCLGNLGGNPDLVIAFVTSDYRKNLPQLIESLQIDGHAKKIVGCTGSGLYGFRKEHENTSGLSLLFLKLPDTEIHRFENPSQTAAIRRKTPEPAGFFLLGNPVIADTPDLLPDLQTAFPKAPVVGGMSAGGPVPDDVFVFTEDGVARSGTLLVSLAGPLRMVPLVSQGCRPIGEPFVVTGSESETILTIGRKRAFAVLEDTWQALPDELQAEADGSIFAGLAIREEVDKFEIGNFLIRHIVSTDLEKGWLELADACRLGQTMQFQMRDGKAAEEALKARCQKIHKTHGSPFAAVLCGGQGRGRKLFGAEDRDVRTLEEYLGIFPLAGFFSNGEFGPAQGISAFHEHSLCAVLFYAEKKGE